MSEERRYALVDLYHKGDPVERREAMAELIEVHRRMIAKERP